MYLNVLLIIIFITIAKPRYYQIITLYLILLRKKCLLTKKYKKTSVDKFLLEQVTKAESVITETKFIPDTDSVAKVMLIDQLVNELEGMTNV